MSERWPMTTINCIETVTPKYTYNTEEIIAAAKKYWLPDLPTNVSKKALRLLEAAEIVKRGSVVPLDIVFSEASFGERNDLYVKAMVEYGSRALKKALHRRGLNACDLDAIITVSCTGFMIPSLDAYLVNELNMKQNIFRLPVTEMGCAGGTSGIIYADQFIRANPGAKVALISVETPSLTFQRNDYSAENLVSTAIFADGASCAILSDTEESGLKLLASSMYNFRNSTHLMGYHLRDSGLKIILDRDVPAAIEAEFNKIILPFLENNKIEAKAIDHFLFHPGGKKIVQIAEAFVKQYDKNLDESKAILQTHGNMSSSTILYIISKAMQEKISPKQKCLGLAFGPGFMAQTLLMEAI